MSTTVDPILMSHAAEPSRRRTMMTPSSTKTTGGVVGVLPVFNKTTMKCDQSAAVVGLPKMSAQTSLLDVIRSQGHAMLALESPLRPLTTTTMTGRTAVASNVNSPPFKQTKPVSKPIRIVASKHRDDVENGGLEEEDPVSSSAELERFYDQATWRMYILIQSARLANDSAPPTAPTGGGGGGGFRGRVPTTSHSHAPYQHHSFSHSTTTTANKGRWTTQCPSSGPNVINPATTIMDSEEDIFDLEL